MVRKWQSGLEHTDSPAAPTWTCSRNVGTPAFPRLETLLSPASLVLMSAVEQIQRLIQQLPTKDFEELSAWLDQQRSALECRRKPQPETASSPLRDHQGFLNSYSPEDEGLYDDAEGR